MRTRRKMCTEIRSHPYRRQKAHDLRRFLQSWRQFHDPESWDRKPWDSARDRSSGRYRTARRAAHAARLLPVGAPALEHSLPMRILVRGAGVPSFFLILEVIDARGIAAKNTLLLADGKLSGPAAQGLPPARVA